MAMPASDVGHGGPTYDMPLNRNRRSGLRPQWPAFDSRETFAVGRGGPTYTLSLHRKGRSYEACERRALKVGRSQITLHLVGGLLTLNRRYDHANDPS
jgi:hypothetical protein